MNIQIFGKSKCFDTKKAERWFKERRIKYQSVDLLRYGMSGGEFDSVLRAVERRSAERTRSLFICSARALHPLFHPRRA